jgi:methionyl-tRNA formyltransferase
MKIVFCGTPQFAVPALKAIVAAGHEVALVVTQPDRQSGRGLELAAPPVKQTALALGLSVVQPEKIRNNAEFRAQLEAIAPEAIVVVAYGRIIPKWMLDLPPLGNINLHASLLPKYRGAAPIQWAVANGEAVTGSTTMRIDAGLDTGEMLLRGEIPIDATQTAQELFPVLAEAGAPLMVETLAGLAAGSITPVRQNEAEASLAPILTREDAEMAFARTAQQLYNRWRGFQPWPGAYTFFRGKKLIVHRMQSAAVAQASAAPDIALGAVLVAKEQLLVQCGDGTVLELLEVQMEGKKRVTAAEFLRGHQLKPGERLGK